MDVGVGGDADGGGSGVLDIDALQLDAGGADTPIFQQLTDTGVV